VGAAQPALNFQVHIHTNRENPMRTSRPLAVLLGAVIALAVSAANAAAVHVTHYHSAVGKITGPTGTLTVSFNDTSYTITGDDYSNCGDGTEHFYEHNYYYDDPLGNYARAVFIGTSSATLSIGRGNIPAGCSRGFNFTATVNGDGSPTTTALATYADSPCLARVGSLVSSCLLMEQATASGSGTMTRCYDNYPPVACYDSTTTEWGPSVTGGQLREWIAVTQ
jgi:hypothetical protein